MEIPGGVGNNCDSARQLAGSEAKSGAGVTVPHGSCLISEQFVTPQEIEKIDEIDNNERKLISHSTPKIKNHEAVDCH